MKIKIKTLHKFSIILLIILASFLSPIQEILSQSEVLLCYLISFAILLFVLFESKRLIIRKGESIFYFPVFILICLYIFNNHYLSHNNLGYFMIGIASLIIMATFPLLNNWSLAAVKAVQITSAIHVMFTFYFFIFPAHWKIYSNAIFGSYVPGTQNGAIGYTASLNGHYSTNGTLVAFGAICFMIQYLLADKKRTKRKYLILMTSAIIAILLTQKRAHIIFFAITFICTYTMYNFKQGAIRNAFKLIVVFLAAWVLLGIAIQFVPVLSAVFKRFLIIGEDAQTLTRFTMWQYALNLFSSNKLIGIGWGGFRYRFVELNMFEGAANAHNIYLQLLSETGIIGLISFLFLAAYSIINVAILLKNRKKYMLNKEDEHVLLFSMSFQMFLLLYGFTGNPIYDFCFIYYAVAIAIGVNLKFRLRGNPVESQLHNPNIQLRKVYR